jgi:hypothetical protein
MNEQRRIFLKKIGRMTVLAGLVGIGANLLLRQDDKDQSCNYDFICRNCTKNKTCRLPEAQAWQHELNKKEQQDGQE